MSTRSIRLFLASAVVVVAASMATYGSDGGNILYVGAYVILCGLGWRAAARADAGSRLPWVLIATAVTLWLTGDLVELVHFYRGSMSAVGLGDVFWLGGYPLVAVALVLMARRRAPGRMRAAVLDTLTLTLAAAAASWQFLIEPLLQSAESLATAVVPALYPVGDVVLLAGTLFIALSPGARTAPTRLLLAATGVYLGMDLGYNLLPYVLDWSWVDRLGPLVMLGNALIIAAGLHPDRAELTRVGDRSHVLHPARVVFLGLALMTAPLLAMLQSGFNGRGIVLITATLGCAAFVLARFTTAVREQERFQAQLAFQARHDALTGLANRIELGDRLSRLRPGPDAPVSVLYLDLDGFKQVNDEHGHEAGDAVLQVVSRRLSAAVRETDLVTRLGGDEFVLLCPVASPAEAAELADRVVHDLTRPIVWQGLTLHVGVSIGVATDAGDASSNLIRRADHAMYEAKREGRGRWVPAGAAAARG
ncbi:GGDEF domain-containing protein [Actinoplanes sp. TRM 88003]|uniref:GGDEF domain-containing protein n=1 Tax=Paractinoplanes aksuensis TaxID=2939490 RepID=A0ABT1E3M1_9ACTN|nr:GGDEF domain-containing protein [Actinoplanes aksuensis]MCO8277727.1 GGDEF domain-containing protein [Actinoplanes aksuensis]